MIHPRVAEQTQQKKNATQTEVKNLKQLPVTTKTTTVVILIIVIIIIIIIIITHQK